MDDKNLLEKNPLITKMFHLLRFQLRVIIILYLVAIRNNDSSYKKVVKWG